MAVVAMAAMLAMLGSAPDLRAQAPEPLQKSEVIRLLSGGTYTQGEVASIVARSCLSFRPTERDLANFRALGASDRVMSAIEGCAAGPRQPAAPAERSETPPERPPPQTERPPATRPQPPAQPPVDGDASRAATLFVTPRQTAVPVGEEVEVVAELTLGASPVSNVRLELRRGTPGEGGDVVATAVTGRDGRATLRVPGADDPGFRWFSVLSVDRPMRGDNVIEVRTQAPTTAASEPRASTDEGRSSAGERAEERPLSPEEEAARQVGGTAPPDVSPVARSIPLLPESVSIEDREAALAEARRLSQEGRYGHAEAIFRQLLDTRRDVGVLLEYGRHLSRAGQHAEADRVLARAEAMAPSDLEVLKARAFVKLWLDEPAQAVRRYRRVVDLDPGDVTAWRGLARALMADGRPQEAREASRRAAELASPD